MKITKKLLLSFTSLIPFVSISCNTIKESVQEEYYFHYKITDNIKEIQAKDKEEIIQSIIKFNKNDKKAKYFLPDIGENTFLPGNIRVYRTESTLNYGFISTIKQQDNKFLIIKTLDDFNDLVINNFKTQSKYATNFSDEQIKELFEKFFLRGKDISDILMKNHVLIQEADLFYNIANFEKNKSFEVYKGFDLPFEEIKGKETNYSVAEIVIWNVSIKDKNGKDIYDSNMFSPQEKDKRKSIALDFRNKEAEYVKSSYFAPTSWRKSWPNMYTKDNISWLNYDFFSKTQYMENSNFIQINTLDDFNNLIINNFKKRPNYANYLNDNEIKKLFEHLYLIDKDVNEVLKTNNIYILEADNYSTNILNLETDDSFKIYTINYLYLKEGENWRSAIFYPINWKVFLVPKNKSVTFVDYHGIYDYQEIKELHSILHSNKN